MKRTTAFILTLLLVFSTALAACPIGIFAADTTAKEITESIESYTGTIGYGGYIVRAKSDGSIMLSPFLSQLRADVNAGASISDYTAEMTFTLLQSDGGAAVHTFDTVYATINKSNGQYFDIYINGSKGTTGFCPIAGEFYKLDLNIYTGYGTDAQTLVYYGTYDSAQIPTGISTAKYYNPTQPPVKAPQITETTDSYTGSIGYSGGIRVKSDKSIMFSPYITELKALYDAGESMSDYKAELTFELLSGKDGTVEHKFDTVSAPLKKSNAYFDIFLNGTGESAGFCPTAGCYYNITVEIYKYYGTTDQTLKMFGTYKNVFAPETLESSSYYDPTPTKIQISETVDGYASGKWYGDGIRKNSSGLIMFSPFITQLRADVDKGASADSYKVVADFSLLDDDSKVVHTFEDIVLKPNKSSNGSYFDIPLQSSTVDCGFCPTAGSKYNVYVEIYDSENVLKYYGEYKGITAGSSLTQSNYYRPTAVPGAPIEYNISLSYSFNNVIPGSAAGKIFVTVDKPGYFEIGWGDKDGKALTVTTGEKTLTYSALNSFTLTAANGGSYVENIIAFTAIPVGAKTLIITDAADNVLKTLALPEDKLLEQKAPEYTFGVVSDVHYNYFYDSATSADYAENAVDVAFDFYKAAGVKLVAAAGDYSLYAEEESYREYYDAVARSGLLVLACGGNHELYASLDVMFGENGYWRTYMNTGIYDGTVDGVLDIADNGIDFTYQIPGVEDAVFVSLSQWYWDGHTASQKKLVEPEQLTWLEEQFELHKDKTVYFLFHTYLSDDDGENVDGQGDLRNPGGYSYNGHYNTHTPDEKILRGLLTKYNNVVWYNGHSHYEYSMQMFNENLNIFDYQGTTATMVHVPSVTNPRTVGINATSYSSLCGKASQGALQFVYDGYDIMNGVDLWSEEILSYACYIIYTDKSDIVEEGTISGTDITWTYDAQLSSLRILGEGEIPSFTATEAPWAEYANDILTLYVGSDITAIGEGAFSTLRNLSKVELKGVKTIGKNAFASTAIETLILPECLEVVEDGAFKGVTTVTAITFGGTLEKWSEVTIGTDNGALNGTKTYKKVRVTFIAGDVTVVEDVVVGTVPSFNGIPSKTHEDPNKHYLFTGWTDGTKKYSTTDPFAKATANVTYTALFENEVDRYITGVIANSAITWTIDRVTATLTISGTGAMPDYATSPEQPWAAYGSEIVTVVVESGITVIGKNAFSHLPVFTTAIIKDGVKVINMDAFAYCEKLTTMTIPASITTLGQGVVYASNNITTVNYGGASIAGLKAANGGSYYNGLRDDEVSGGFANVTTWNFNYKEIVTGFVTDADGIRYYYEDGSYAKGWKTIDGKTYRFDGNGILFEGESLVYGSQTFWFGADNAVLEGLVLDADGYRFYIGGVRQYAWQDTDGDGNKDSYFYTSSYLRCEEDRMLFDGVASRRFYKYNAETGHMEVVNGFYTNEKGTQFFTNGIGRYGWITPEGEIITDRPGIEIGGAYYFAYGDGTNHYMIEAETITIGGVIREFGSDNLVKAYTGWSYNSNTGSSRYYIDGEMQMGWVETAEGWVYLSRSESIENNIEYGDAFYGWRTINGKVYYFRATTSNPAFVVISDPLRALFHPDGKKDLYQINQTPEGEQLVGSDFYIVNPPTGI